ncbi:hypothetical protein NIES298_46800, partial [Microcystis aeruginosa NIES-298]
PQVCQPLLAKFFDLFSIPCYVSFSAFRVFG